MSELADVRQCSVNLNYWWPIAHEQLFPQSGLLGVRLGTKELLVVKENADNFAVYDDFCPHKMVRLSRYGKRTGNELLCTYHGWRFDQQSGECTSLATMPGKQEKFCLNGYPVRRYGGWIWAFPGDPTLAETRVLPTIPPVEQAGRYYKLPMQGKTGCHFSFITENATDLFHAELHKAQQPWANPELQSLEQDDRTVHAIYEVDTPNPLANLFAGGGKKRIHVKYEYPYIHIYEEAGDFYLFVTYLPMSPQSTFVHSTFFFPHILGIEWLSRILVPIVQPFLLSYLSHATFRKVFKEDIDAVEEEQRAYNLYGKDMGKDTNPVTHAVRQVIRHQTDQQMVLQPEPRIAEPGRPL